MAPLQAPLSNVSSAAGPGVKLGESQTAEEYTTGNEPAGYLHGIHIKYVI